VNPPLQPDEQTRAGLRGGLAASLAFVLWGILPFFWKALERFDPFVIISHRLLWSLLFIIPLLLWYKEVATTLKALCTPRLVAVHALAGLLLTTNWFFYVLATVTGRILEGALGYFIMPLVTLFIARVVFGEKLSRRQRWAVSLACVGVVLQLVLLGRLPWIALLLAFSFGIYGALRKFSTLSSLPGLAVETTLIAPFALLFLIFAPLSAGLHDAAPVEFTLLVLTGLATATPLLLFAYGTRIIRFSTISILQFIGPSLQFLIGWLVYKEPLELSRMVSFVCIWTGLAIYLADILAHKPKIQPQGL